MNDFSERVFQVVREIPRGKLEAEGVQFLPDGRVDMKACGWFGENEE